MKRFFVLLLALASPVVFSHEAGASETFAQARSYTYSCGYYSSRAADVEITYHNEKLEWGVIVQLVFGHEGEIVRGGGNSVVFEKFQWDQQANTVVAAVGPFKWSGGLNVPVTYRSSPRFVNGLNFVFKIVHPDGRVEYDNGTASPLGFYKIHLPDYAPCVEGQVPAGDFSEVLVERIDRG